MIALYSRVSTQEQAAEGYSIGEQQDRLAAFALSFGWKDFRQYSDPGFSGASLDRPAMQELIRDVRAGKISRVIVYKLDRLSRSQKDTLFLIEDVFLAHGCEFVSMSESFSTETPVGRATIGLLAVFAQLERETIKERLTVGRVARAKAGLAHVGVDKPCGYSYKDGHLSVIEDEAAQVREIYRLYLSGLTLREIAISMTDRGHLFRGGPWSQKHVRDVLRNVLYTGKVHFSGEVYPGQHEPIIDQETFDRVQDLLAARRRACREKGQRTYSGKSLLTGLVFCAKCGCRMTPSVTFQRGHRYEYFKCQARQDKMVARRIGHRCDAKAVRSEKLEEAVLSQVKLLQADPAAMIPKKKEEPDERPGLRAQVARLDSQISRLLDLYADGSFSLDVLTEKTEALRAARASCQAELDAAEKKAASSGADRAQEALRSFPEAIEAMDAPRLKMIIRDLIERIEYADDDLRIFWKIK